MVDLEAFRGFVGEALVHLYRPVHLRQCLLSRLLTDGGLIRSPEELASYLTASIEDLRQPSPAPHGSPGWRQYRYLYLRYVATAGHRQIAEDLGLSTRQATREHESGLQALSGLLWSRYAAVASRVPVTNQTDLADADKVGADLIDLGARHPPAPTSLQDVVDGALATVSRMALAAPVDLHSELPDDLRLVVVSKPLLRHLLIGVLGFMIERSSPNARLRIGAVERPGVTDLLLSVEPATDSHFVSSVNSNGENELAFARRLAVLQGIQLDFLATSVSMEAALSLPTVRAKSVLYVDDSADMGRLFRQYLTGTGYGLIQARTAERGMQLARAAPPDVIILDVMLPTEDGWQLLERLRADRETASTPVIVCTILPEASLAASLGIEEFLTKPITQTALLSTLARCCPTD